ncbi:hypothetical protein ACQP3L_34560, partial [Escherichia coli]
RTHTFTRFEVYPNTKVNKLNENLTISMSENESMSPLGLYYNYLDRVLYFLSCTGTYVADITLNFWSSCFQV